jgi:hypothetical protein
MAIDVRQSLTFTPSQQQRLNALVNSDPHVRQLWRSVDSQAEAACSIQPQPLAVIHFEGMLDTHPDRIESTRQLADMDRLAVLNFAYAASGKEAYAQAMRTYVLAWSHTFQPTGNTINENILYAVLVGYDLLGPHWSSAEKNAIEDWMKRIVELEIASIPLRPNTVNNNWQTKRLNLIGTVGVICSQPELIAYAQNGYREYLSTGLFADGTSIDFHRRDALSYHQSGLKSMVVLARQLEQVGLDLWREQAENGASAARSIDWLIPYVDGTQVHEEWVKTSSTLDRQRAEAGIPFFKTGKLYEPLNALELYELASYFDPRYLEITRLLTHSPGDRFPTWLTAACSVKS